MEPKQEPIEELNQVKTPREPDEREICQPVEQVENPIE